MLPELENHPELLEFQKEKISKGILTKLSKIEGLRHYQQVAAREGNSFHVASIGENHLNQIIYFEITKTGDLARVFLEKEGKVARIFIGTDQRLWTILDCLATKKELEIILPLRNRKGLKKPKKIPAFTGEWLGNSKDVVCFQMIDFFENKPDKLCTLEFNRDGLIRKKLFKLPFPNKNYIYLEKQGYLQLLAEDNNNKWLHRRTNINGVLIKERTLDLGIGLFAHLRLSFNGVSEVLNAYGNFLALLIVQPNRTVEAHPLFQLEPNENFYNLSPATYLKEATYLVRFTTSSGNGWAIIQHGELVECFLYEVDLGVYKDLVSGTVLELPKSGEYLISGASATFDGGYQVTLTYNGEESKEILIFSREKFL